MNTLFVSLLLGHLTADYLLQTKNMALQKSQPGIRGVIACTVHCCIYTASIMLFLNIWTLPVALVIFASHWPIDRWSLADKWLKFINGRTFIDAYQSNGPYREFDIAFTCIVYTIADNTMHILLMWFLVPYVM